MSTARNTGAAGAPDAAAALLTELLALEAAAMDRWGAGDPDGFLELSDDDVTYVDPWQPHRLNTRAELARVYEQIRGQVHIDSYEFVDPVVVAAGDLALLSFHFVSTGSEGQLRWNTTEVYRRSPERGWRIVHSHWSLTDMGSRLAGADPGQG